MFKRIDHVEIVPKNAEKTIDFYVNILGFKIKNRKEIKMPRMKEVIYLQLGDTVMEVIPSMIPSRNQKSPGKQDIGESPWKSRIWQKR